MTTTTQKPFYGIRQACEDVAWQLNGGNDYSATTIRCAINDTLDAQSKSGFRVNHAYNQPRAVATVKRMLRTK